MPKINISKIAYGSLTTTIGDGTLGYSNGVSSRAREVDGIYVDNPPRLSTGYSSLVWKYYPETDNYMLTHVQGQHTVEASMARKYPYRGAYEVSRQEMNRVGFPVAAVMDCMPRIRHYENHETWDTETELCRHVLKADSARARTLALAIELVVNDGKRLYIGMDARGRDLKENGVFAADELLTLVEAIDLLDVNLRRYASFAFCVDENHETQLDDVLVVIYVKGSRISIPQDAKDIDWNGVFALNCEKTLGRPDVGKSLGLAAKVYPSLPGRDEKVLPLSDMFRKLADWKQRLGDLEVRPHGSFSAEDYRLWLGLGHSAGELSVGSWEEIDRILGILGDDRKAVNTFVANHRAKVISWKIDSLTKDRILMFGLKDIMNVQWIGAHSKEIESRLDYWFDMFKSLSLLKGDVKEGFRQAYLVRFKAEPVRCLDDYKALRSRYRGKIEDADFPGRFSALNPVKDKVLIEELLSAKELYPVLCSIALEKSKQLGMNVDGWMKFLESLKDGDTALTRSIAFYIKAIAEWPREDVNRIKELAAEYPDAHPRKAQKEPFLTFLKMLKLIDGDAEPVSPSSETRETGGAETKEDKEDSNEKRRNYMDSENNEIKGLDSKFDRIYEEIMHAQAKKRKTKVIILSLASFLIGIVLTGGVWFASARLLNGGATSGGTGDGSEAGTDSIPVSLSFDAPQNFMLQLANLDSLIENVKVQVGDTAICGIGDINALYAVDSLFMLNGSSADYADAAATVYRIDSTGNKIDSTRTRIEFGKNISLLSKVYTAPYRVGNVTVYSMDGKDSLFVDINNKTGFVKDYPGKSNAGTNDITYYMWLIRQVNNSLVEKDNVSRIAY